MLLSCLIGEVVNAQGALPYQPCGVDSGRRPVSRRYGVGTAWHARFGPITVSEYADGRRVHRCRCSVDFYELDDVPRTTLTGLLVFRPITCHDRGTHTPENQSGLR